MQVGCGIYFRTPSNSGHSFATDTRAISLKSGTLVDETEVKRNTIFGVIIFSCYAVRHKNVTCSRSSIFGRISSNFGQSSASIPLQGLSFLKCIFQSTDSWSTRSDALVWWLCSLAEYRSDSEGTLWSSIFGQFPLTSVTSF